MTPTFTGNYGLDHMRQYEILGDMFWIIWGASGLTSQGLCGTGVVNIDHCVHDSNILEILAD